MPLIVFKVENEYKLHKKSHKSAHLKEKGHAESVLLYRYDE